MSVTQQKEVWASGNAYEAYVGRWSRLVARELLAWLNVPPNSTWLDVGCGTGALTQTILHTAQPRAVTSLDRSTNFVGHVRAQIDAAQVRCVVGDAQALPLPSSIFDALVSGLMLNFVPQPQPAVNDMVRVVRSGGVVGVYVWDYADKMQFMRYFWDAVAALDPARHDLDEGQRFPICQPAPLKAMFQTAGLQAVVVQPIDIATHFRNFDDYWQPFLGGQGPGPSYVMSLSADHRAALRARLQTTLPFAPDGSIPLIARAWAVRGTKA